MRHEKVFPGADIELLSFFKNAWEKGLLDKYPDNHIIIQAIENRLESLSYLSQLINHNAVSMYTAIKPNGEIDYSSFAMNFLINLSMKLGALQNKFNSQTSRSKFNDFISDQLAASTKAGLFSIDRFLQALSEIEILAFFAGYNWDECIYEKPIGKNGENPEATFVIKEDNKRIRFNIEVKTPEFKTVSTNKRIILPAYLLSDKGKEYYKKQCKDSDVEFLAPRITKLAEFLESATKKFNDYSDTEINLLFINWTYSDITYGGYLEAWSLLTNAENGLFKFPEIAKSLNFSTKITDETFKRISAVVVYTSSLDEMMFNSFSHVFIQSQGIKHHFRMFINDSNPRSVELIREFTSMNPDFDYEPLVFPLFVPFNTSEEMRWAMLHGLMKGNIKNTALKK